MRILTRRRYLSVPLAALAALLVWQPGLAAAPPSGADAHRYIEDVRFLASPELQGRGAGSVGLERAATYIGERFRSLGLRPAGDAGSFLQAFTVTTDAKAGPANRLTVAGQGGERTLRMGTDFTPISFSSNRAVKGRVVFAGYGITADEFHYDDYAHLEVKDSIVLVLRDEPPSFHTGKANKEQVWTHHANLIAKAINARNRGAAAILFVNAESGQQPEDTLIRFGSIAGPEDAGIAIGQVTRAVAGEWLSARKSLSELQKQIDKDSSPASFALPEDVRVSLEVDVEREHATVHNVAGYLPGETSEYVVLGAHFDHLGLGNESSLAPSLIGQVHPGADDNASGTAGLLELARLLSSGGGQRKRGILFLAFAGEEIGLLGSAHWVNNPTLPLDRAIAMINMDMIGRVSGSKVYIGGTGTGSTFDPMLKRLITGFDFKIDFSAGGYSSSDHTSFVAKGVPVLFFFSGLHADYHKPSDTWDKIDAVSAARVVDLVYDVTVDLDAAADRPKFVKVAEPASPGGRPGSGYGPYFGSIPDFGPVETGVKFSDVRPGSPAEKAGLRGGDILIRFGDKPIANLYDFTFALRGSKVGDVVEVRVLRDGKEITAKVKLEQRR